MHFKIPELLKYITSLVVLNPGDMIITGSPPHGFGVIKEGDKIEGYLKENGKVLAEM